MEEFDFLNEWAPLSPTCPPDFFPILFDEEPPPPADVGAQERVVHYSGFVGNTFVKVLNVTVSILQPSTNGRTQLCWACDQCKEQGEERGGVAN